MTERSAETTLPVPPALAGGAGPPVLVEATRARRRGRYNPLSRRDRLFLGLMVGIPMWMVMRRPDWHGKLEARTVPAYLARRAHPVRASMVRVHRSAGYDHRSMRPATDGANG